jgi:hypothetical protein
LEAAAEVGVGDSHFHDRPAVVDNFVAAKLKRQRKIKYMVYSRRD